jgi:ubiquinone/menaquinone biosynthesis C-methylase UbiE
MKVPREFSVKVQYVLDQWVPPRIRDSKWFMYLPMKLVLKDTVDDFMTFKQKVFTMSASEFSGLYERTVHVQELQGETDLNQACTKEILKTIRNKTVLEVGCGRGYLAEKLAQKNKVTACDIVLSDKLKASKGSVSYIEANIESLPFKDDAFDYIVTTHTLEHVQRLSVAIAELRRVAKHGLVIVVPRQRPYKYTFSLHTQFFPYEWSLQAAFNSPKNAVIKYLGDWFYIETYKP